MRPARVLWLSALTLAALATWTLFDAAPGLNWGLWTMAACAAGFLCGRGTGPGPRSTLAAIASLFAAGAAVTADRAFHFWTGLGTIGLLATAVRLTGDPRPERVTLSSLLTAVPVTTARAMVEAGRRVGGLVDRMSGTRWRPAIRGGAAAVVVVGTLGGILAGADPILAALRDGLVEALERLDFLPRLLFFAGALVVALGSLGIIVWTLSPNAVPALAVGDRPSSVREGLRERYGDRSRVIPCRWFEWNLGHRRAVDALLAAGMTIGGVGPESIPAGCVRIAWGG